MLKWRFQRYWNNWILNTTGCEELFAFQYLDTIRVKGKSQPASVYAPLRREDATTRREELLFWQDACELYRSGDFAKAVDAFTGLCQQFPDVKLYAVHAERARSLPRDPPADWDGVWTAIKK
jgi:adenylate cyclase